MADPFRPALIVVDFQQDFCPPNGSLAVQGGRSLAPLINTLLALPFAIKIATRDWHPASHISFAANHPPPAAPFTSTHTITQQQQQQHPGSTTTTTTSSSYTMTLWPVHCVAGSPGAQLVPELDAQLVDRVLDKGQRPDREMLSAFCDPFGESDSGLAALLRSRAVTHVFVAGLAFDYCVRATAEHAAQQGFATFVVGDATKAVFPDKWDDVVTDLQRKGVAVIPSSSPQLQRVRALSS